MARLSNGEWLGLTTPLTAGMVIIINSDEQDLSPFPNGPGAAKPKGPIETNIQLLNDAKDVVLEISIRRAQNAVLFNSRAKESALDGWGQPESIPLSVVGPPPRPQG